MNTAIKLCTCKHEYQDQRFGKSMRAMNRKSPKINPPVYRCTVCKKEH